MLQDVSRKRVALDSRKDERIKEIPQNISKKMIAIVH